MASQKLLPKQVDFDSILDPLLGPIWRPGGSELAPLGPIGRPNGPTWASGAPKCSFWYPIWIDLGSFFIPFLLNFGYLMEQCGGLRGACVRTDIWLLSGLRLDHLGQKVHLEPTGPRKPKGQWGNRYLGFGKVSQWFRLQVRWYK